MAPPVARGKMKTPPRAKGMFRRTMAGQRRSILASSGQIDVLNKIQKLLRRNDEPVPERSEGGGYRASRLKVAVRVRPLNARERNSRNVISVVGPNMLVFDPKQEEPEFFFQNQKLKDVTAPKQKNMTFAFDHVYGEETTNGGIFEDVMKPLINMLLTGFNCSVFAYGATGSGKTYTMLGGENNPGLTYLTVNELYTRLNEMEDNYTSEVVVSYLEVYNEQVRDLLNPASGQLTIREAGNGIVVTGLSYHRPAGVHELLQMLHQGNGQRSQHPTDHNAESSRSHAVLQINVQMRAKHTDMTTKTKTAKMVMVDLAGSEKGTATGFTGERFREGASINKSLLALSNCISALAQGKPFAAFRDSKLTRLLKDSLGGNCKTVMIANISPACLMYEDTLNTLRYADKAKKISCQAKKNTMTVHTCLSQYTRVVEEMSEKIVNLEAELKEKKEELAAKNELLANQNDELRIKSATLKSVEQQLRTNQAILISKDREIGHVKYELEYWKSFGHGFSQSSTDPSADEKDTPTLVGDVEIKNSFQDVPRIPSIQEIELPNAQEIGLPNAQKTGLPSIEEIPLPTEVCQTSLAECVKLTQYIAEMKKTAAQKGKRTLDYQTNIMKVSTKKARQMKLVELLERTGDSRFDKGAKKLSKGALKSEKQLLNIKEQDDKFEATLNSMLEVEYLREHVLDGAKPSHFILTLNELLNFIVSETNLHKKMSEVQSLLELRHILNQTVEDQEALLCDAAILVNSFKNLVTHYKHDTPKLQAEYDKFILTYCQLTGVQFSKAPPSVKESTPIRNPESDIMDQDDLDLMAEIQASEMEALQVWNQSSDQEKAYLTSSRAFVGLSPNELKFSLGNKGSSASSTVVNPDSVNEDKTMDFSDSGPKAVLADEQELQNDDRNWRQSYPTDLCNIGAGTPSSLTPLPVPYSFSFTSPHDYNPPPLHTVISQRANVTSSCIPTPKSSVRILEQPNTRHNPNETFVAPSFTMGSDAATIGGGDGKVAINRFEATFVKERDDDDETIENVSPPRPANLLPRGNPRYGATQKTNVTAKGEEKKRKEEMKRKVSLKKTPHAANKPYSRNLTASSANKKRGSNGSSK